MKVKFSELRINEPFFYNGVEYVKTSPFTASFIMLANGKEIRKGRLFTGWETVTKL